MVFVGGLPGRERIAIAAQYLGASTRPITGPFLKEVVTGRSSAADEVDLPHMASPTGSVLSRAETKVEMAKVTRIGSRSGMRILIAHNVSKSRTGGMSRLMGFIHDRVPGTDTSSMSLPLTTHLVTPADGRTGSDSRGPSTGTFARRTS